MPSETLFPQRRKHFRLRRRQNINLVITAVQPQGDGDEGRYRRHRRQQREQVAVCRHRRFFARLRGDLRDGAALQQHRVGEGGGEGGGVALDVGGERGVGEGQVLRDGGEVVAGAVS